MDGLTLTRSLRAIELCDPTGPDLCACKGRQEYARNAIAARFPRCSLSCHTHRRRRPGNSEATLLELPATVFYFGTRPR